MNCKCPYCDKIFDNWNSVRAHSSKCKNLTSIYYIDSYYGPIHYSEFLNNDCVEEKYPNLSKDKIRYIRKKYHKKGIRAEPIWTKEKIIESIQKFYRLNNRIPFMREFERNTYPNRQTVKDYFGSWNKGIKAAGFEPNIFNGFGIDTFGKDGHLYRSIYEAYFADNYLYGKYEYEIEPKYPKPYYRYYDWYIPNLDLYVELDGGCRPIVIEEKKKINKELKRNVLYIKTSEIEEFDWDDLWKRAQ